ncbi:MAG: ubiquinone biosynthesis protein UbiB, partial [Novosphingobium sp.]
LQPDINMWDVSGPFVQGWIRDELGPEAALADRLRKDSETILRLPELLRRIEDRFPARGGAPDEAPLPDLALVWDGTARKRGWAGYGLALALGGIAVWAAMRVGWLI